MGVVAGARRERRATGDAEDTEAEVDAIEAAALCGLAAAAPALSGLVACVVVRTMVMRATGLPDRDGIARTNTFCTTSGAALPPLLLLLEFGFEVVVLTRVPP